MSGSLLKSTTVVSTMTLLSRVLGLVRDVLFATLGGAGAAMDAFLVAFKIPNFMRRLFAEGAFTQAFVPVFAEYRQQGDEDELKRVTSQVAGTLGGVLILVTLFAELFTPLLATPFAAGFLDDPEKFDQTVTFLRITFPYLLFISLVSLCAGILNSYGRFMAAAFAPVLLNVCLISAAVIGSAYMELPQLALAWGVFVAGLLQLAFLWWRVIKLGFVVKPSWAWGSKPVRKILRLMAPAAFGSSIAQINLLLDTMIATFLFSGSVSWLYYSDRLMEFPLGVLAIAIATVILPRLSQQHASKSLDDFRKTLDWALRIVAVLIVPAAAGLFVLAGPLVATLFQYGEFTAADALASRASLMAYSIGLLGFTAVKVLVPGFFARQDTRTPVKIGLIAMGFNMLFNLALVLPLVWAGWQYPHVGLALATSLGAILNASLLAITLRRQGILRWQPGWTLLLLRILIANVVMVALLLWLHGTMQSWFDADMGLRLARLLVAVVAAIVAYVAVLFATGLRPRQLRLT